MRISDWSSDVCSSDLFPARGQYPARHDAAQPRARTGARRRHGLCRTRRTHRGGSVIMSRTQIKRGKAPPRRPALAPKKRRKIQQSRLNAILNALPISPQRLRQVANWTIDRKSAVEGKRVTVRVDLGG